MRILLAVGLGFLFAIPVLTRHPNRTQCDTLELPPPNLTQNESAVPPPADSSFSPARLIEEDGPVGGDTDPGPGAEPVHASSAPVDDLEARAAAVPETEIPSVLERLTLDSSADASTFRQLLLRRWADLDPSAAAVWALELPEGPVQDEAFEQVAIAWANLDLVRATNWVHQLPEGPGKLSGMMGVAYEAARTDPLAALRIGAALPTSPSRDALLDHTLSQWAWVDGTAAANWALEVSDADLRERLVSAVGMSMAGHDAEAALALVYDRIQPGPLRDRAIASIARRWEPENLTNRHTPLPGFAGTWTREDVVREFQVLHQNDDSLRARSRFKDLPEAILKELGATAALLR